MTIYSCKSKFPGCLPILTGVTATGSTLSMLVAMVWLMANPPKMSKDNQRCTNLSELWPALVFLGLAVVLVGCTGMLFTVWQRLKVLSAQGGRDVGKGLIGVRSARIAPVPGP